MNPETYKAWQKSCAHWRRLLLCETAEEIKAEGFGVQHCALCARFWDKERCAEDEEIDPLQCTMASEKCPIYRVTGQNSCHGSPYWDAAFFLGAETGNSEFGWKVNPKNRRKAVLKMYEFLLELPRRLQRLKDKERGA